jgi:hypothetical protein
VLAGVPARKLDGHQQVSDGREFCCIKTENLDLGEP